MANAFFNFKNFSVLQDKCAMKVGTDGVMLGAWINPKNATSILDIGTGTGLLALMMAQKNSKAYIDAIDCEEGAYIQALENVRQSKWKERIAIYHKSLQDYQSCNKKYDLIISNPPFFENSLKSPQDERTLARHNYSLSTNDLLYGACNLMDKGGRLCVILPYLEAQLFIVDAALKGLYCIRKTEIRPSPEKKIHRIIMEFSFTRLQPEMFDFTIRNDKGVYSNEYVELTKDFYLDF